MTTARSPIGVVDLLISLYETYLDPLRAVRERQRALHASGLRARLDDVEAELTYLLIRARRPASVVEIDALDGWSTSWILSALRDNGSGRLLTMDLTPNATFLVPEDLAADRWTFRAGDARHLPADWLPGVGHLFVDAEHSARFARWYVADVLPHLAPGATVSVHDVFRRAHPSREGAVVLDWLATRGIGYLTASRRAAADVHERLMRFRRRHGLAEPIHPVDRNPMVFFHIPPARKAG